MLRPRTDVSSSPCLRPCLQDRIMFAASYAYSQIYWSWGKLQNCHTNIYFKTKTVVAHGAKCWTRCHIFRNVENKMLNPVQYLSKHSVQSYAVLLVAVANASKPQLLRVCRSCWVFTELTWNLSIRSKGTWPKSFLMLLAYRKQIIQNQCKTVRRIITINVCWRKSSCELFPLATSYAKVANSGSGKMW